MNKIIGLMLVLMLLVPGLCMAEGNRISFLGPEGTYTEEAARFWFQDEGTFQARETVNDTIADVAAGKADFAVIPQENSIGGAVVNYVDALLRAENVCIVGEVVLPISQTLMALPGATLEDIRTVCSHSQGLIQSAQWREKNLPEAEPVEMPSTAAAAEYVSRTGDKSIAAVAAPGAARLYNLQVLAQDVQLEANHTRFYVLSAKPAEGEKTTRAVFAVDGDGGKLTDFIVKLHEAGLGVVTLHVRPDGSALGLYHFLVEAENAEGIREEQMAACMLPDVRALGQFNSASKETGNAKLTLDRVVVLSRHNIRSPLSGSGSLLGDITPPGLSGPAIPVNCPCAGRFLKRRWDSISASGWKARAYSRRMSVLRREWSGSMPMLCREPLPRRIISRRACSRQPISRLKPMRITTPWTRCLPRSSHSSRTVMKRR